MSNLNNKTKQFFLELVDAVQESVIDDIKINNAAGAIVVTPKLSAEELIEDNLTLLLMDMYKAGKDDPEKFLSDMTTEYIYFSTCKHVFLLLMREADKLFELGIQEEKERECKARAMALLREKSKKDVEKSKLKMKRKGKKN